ncbi:hypothetical protein MMEU_5219 [Mycobacterium marinum str. Europe]|nr:hypothetical protein MMEU_5219 [Mycobacterium marinum str. Europe]
MVDQFMVGPLPDLTGSGSHNEFLALDDSCAAVEPDVDGYSGSGGPPAPAQPISDVDRHLWRQFAKQNRGYSELVRQQFPFGSPA